MLPARRGRRRDLRTALLYVVVLLREFRWTFLGALGAIGAGMLLFCLSGHADPATAAYASWMALLGQQPLGNPTSFLEGVLYSGYPLLGVAIIGEGIVRFGLLMFSRQHADKEWTKVMASTYRDHVILCGLGHLGFRVLQQLVSAKVDVVAIEKCTTLACLPQVRAMNVPILSRDIREDQALLDAGVAHARAIILATNDDMANLEVLLDARRYNPKIRVVMRLFEPQIAGKIAAEFKVDAAFSSSALAAPLVAAIALEGRVLASYAVAGVPYVAAEISVEPTSRLIGRRIADVEAALEARVLTRVPPGRAAETPPAEGATVSAGDLLIVHTREGQLPVLASAGQG